MIYVFATQFSEPATGPWPWYVAGPIIAATMFLLLYWGTEFGFSSNLRTMCTIVGADRVSDRRGRARRDDKAARLDCRIPNSNRLITGKFCCVLDHMYAETGEPLDGVIRSNSGDNLMDVAVNRFPVDGRLDIFYAK